MSDATEDPDRIRNDIERTRDSLSRDVDALAYKASPTRVVRERTDRARGLFAGARDKVMGVASDGRSRVAAGRDFVSDTASSASDATARVPERIKTTAEGNPLAAGVVVFGAAWLISSLLPGTRTERQAVQQATDLAEPMKDSAVSAARDVRENLREPLKDAAASVKSATADSLGVVKQEGQQAAQNVRDTATEQAHHVS